MPKDHQEPQPLPVDEPWAADPEPNPDPASPSTLRGGFEMACAMHGLGGPDSKTAAQDDVPAPDFSPFFVKPQFAGDTQTGLTAVTPTEPDGIARERAGGAGSTRPLHARGAIAFCLTLVVLLATALVFGLMPSFRPRTQRPAALVSPPTLPAVLSAPLARAPETPDPFATPVRAIANTSEAMTSEAIVARQPLATQLASHRTQSSCIAPVRRQGTSVTKGDTWSTTRPCAASANDIDMDDFSQHFSAKRLEQAP